MTRELTHLASVDEPKHKSSNLCGQDHQDDNEELQNEGGGAVGKEEDKGTLKKNNQHMNISGNICGHFLL